ncbi:MAG: LptF/LptG family permease [Gammaproteobacteria bacterium]|nr:LptF/LptG family permease [Gammaproteobacteria bacterium]
MNILTRYLIRAHVAPFFFSLTVLTGLFFLNLVALRMGALMGKGLPWQVYAEFMLLSLPHTLALTIPMSVLVAVLYAFSELAEANEITAMSAGGVRPARVLVPMLAAGTITAGVVFVLHDRVLPESNHRLKNLMVDVQGKSPTFRLREQVINEIQAVNGATRYFLQAHSIDPLTNELEDVTIFDVSEYDQYRTIYANRGTMAFDESGTDLFLTLFDGNAYEVSDVRPSGFRQLAFARQIIPMRGVADVLERSDSEQRGDREMSTAMLAEEVRKAREELAEVRRASLGRSRGALREALGLEAVEGEEIDDLLPPGALESQRRIIGDLGLTPPDQLTEAVTANLRTNAVREEGLLLNVNRYRVEWHKKWAIATACFIFVLVGAPLAIRFPRGGLGTVIVLSGAIFAIYWTTLIGGESLADRGRLEPNVAMWISNVIFLAAGVWLSSRMGRAVSAPRDSGRGVIRQLLANRVRRSADA